MDGWRGTAATTGIFIAAAVTDWLDGYLARKVLIRFLTKRQDKEATFSKDFKCNDADPFIFSM